MGGFAWGVVPTHGTVSGGVRAWLPWCPGDGVKFLYEIHIRKSYTPPQHMNTLLHVPLKADAAQVQRLQDLQKGFARVCNALAPLVQQTRVWNRVALHHMAYRQLREQFPEMGSQMVCNAIYSVSRAGRLVYQHPLSRFNLERLGSKPLPLMRFADSCPVYFDRHTLSVKGGQLSMFTLDGRMRFQLALGPQDEARFHTQKLREVLLTRRRDGIYELAFLLSGVQPGGAGAPGAGHEGALHAGGDGDSGANASANTDGNGAADADTDTTATADGGAVGTGEIPEYIKVEEVQ